MLAGLKKVERIWERDRGGVLIKTDILGRLQMGRVFGHGVTRLLELCAGSVYTTG